MTKYKLILLILVWITQFVWADNPFIQHVRTADPSAQVWADGKVWVYTSHDQDNAESYTSMDGYRVFSSYDMVNWEDHGEILHSRDVAWGIEQGGFMFAPDAAFKNGVYYLFFPHMAKGWNWRIGVATSDRPEGPFTDSGHFIEGTDHIDPCCFVDDDGQAYLYWGGDYQPPKVARLKDNMTELAEAPRIVEYGGDNFGEGAFMHKRKGVYYFSWAHQSGHPYKSYYAMGDSPYGPFELKGPLNPSPPGSQDHHSIINYHGQGYYFYHIGNFKGGSMYRRNSCVDYLYYNEDGTIQTIVQTTEGVIPDLIGSTQGHLIPGEFEAASCFDQLGIEKEETCLASIDAGDWVDYVLDILGTDTYDLTLYVQDVTAGSKVQILVNNIPSVQLQFTEGITTAAGQIPLDRGKHLLRFVFQNEVTAIDILKLDRIGLESDQIYYSIESAATEGGCIEPDGTIYLTAGDSITYQMVQDVNYKLNDVRVDAVSVGNPATHTFRHVNANHTIEALFSSCSGTDLVPAVQVNDLPVKIFNQDTVLVGDQVILSAGAEDTGAWEWLTPVFLNSTTGELDLGEVSELHTGVYTVTFVNAEGCKSQTEFDLVVVQPELDVYEAEDYRRQQGVDTEGTSDVGGGRNVGWIENGDWCEYRLTLDESGVYDMTARVATQTNGGRIEVRLNGTDAAVIPVSGSDSNGWQDWFTTDPVEMNITAGTHDLRMTFKGGGGYLFNINWFNLKLNTSDVEETGHLLMPHSHQLYPVYPNPFNPSTQVRYALSKQSHVDLKVINAIGEEIRDLLNHSQQPAGQYAVRWDGKNNSGNPVPSGIYFVTLKTGDFLQVQKGMLIK